MSDIAAMLRVASARRSRAGPLMLVYVVTLPLAFYFFLSRSAQVRWPWVGDAAILTDATVGAVGALAFLIWWPICLLFGGSPFTDRLCRFGLMSMLWAFYLAPLAMLFTGIQQFWAHPWNVG